MTQWRNILIAIITAPELLLALAVYAFWLFQPSIVEFLGDRLKSDAENWKYLNFLPAAFLAASFKYAARIRAPSEAKTNKTLYNWPEYHLLIARVNMALVFSGLAATCLVSLWLFGKQLESSVVGAIFLAGTLVSAFVVIALSLAAPKINELLTKHGGHP
jgi:hypothetical protein